MLINNIIMEPTGANLYRNSKAFFSDYNNVCHRQYDAFRTFFFDAMQKFQNMKVHTLDRTFPTLNEEKDQI